MSDQIRLLHTSGQKTKTIARMLSVSKNTVRSYLREAVPEASPIEATRPCAGAAVDWEYALGQLALGRVAKRIYEEMAPAMSFAHFTRELRRGRPAPLRQSTLRLTHEPGQKAQVDYCYGIVLLDPKSGSMIKAQFLCGVLPSNSYVFGEFTLSQKLPDFIRSHERMWAYFGGTAKYVVLDNLKSGVTKAPRYYPDINPVYCDFANFRGFAALPERVRTPRDKACVEATIGVIQRDFCLFSRIRGCDLALVGHQDYGKERL